VTIALAIGAAAAAAVAAAALPASRAVRTSIVEGLRTVG